MVLLWMCFKSKINIIAIRLDFECERKRNMKDAKIFD